MSHKRKKNTRLRGSKTHTHGSMKKWRGAGHRGGRGMAGSGKRSDQMKPSIWKKKYFGKSGFSSKSRKKVKAINVQYLDEHIESFDAEHVKKEGDIYAINLTKLGYTKLLGQGKVTKKFKITVAHATRKAIKMIQETGGQVVGIEENGAVQDDTEQSS